MGNRWKKFGDGFEISHDSEDAPMYTHRVYPAISKHLGIVLVAIEDDDHHHYHFLKAWDNMEIDINNQWSLNNGTLALDLILHKDGKNKVHYMVKLSTKNVKKILKTPLNAMAICDDAKNVLLHFRPLQIEQLVNFYCAKTSTDDFIKKNYLSPKCWSVE